MNFTIDEIVSIPLLNVGYSGPDGILSTPVERFVIDSRKVQPGDVFIALRGERFDAHDFLIQVFDKGALAAVVDRQWAENFKLPGACIIVDDTLFALQEIAHAYRSKFDIPIVGLTGSNGKTTTKEMIAAVLSRKWNILRNQGNLNNHIGVPVTLLGLDESHEIAVIEMGTNHFGEIERLAEIAAPTIGLITNVGPAHLEFFGSLEGVAKAKTELWNYVVAHDGMVLVNVDDRLLEKNAPSDARQVTYGFDNQPVIKGLFAGMDERGCPRITVQNRTIQLQIPGVHNIYNALSAVVVGMQFDMDMGTIQDALEGFRPTARRMEVIQAGDVTILNDCYNANLASVEKALQTLHSMVTAGKRIAVLADMLELGDLSEAHHRKAGETAVEMGVDALFTCGKESRHTAAAASESGGKNVFYFQTKYALIDDLLEMVTEKDIILVKGSRGMAMEDVTQALVEKFATQV